MKKLTRWEKAFGGAALLGFMNFAQRDVIFALIPLAIFGIYYFFIKKKK